MGSAACGIAALSRCGGLAPGERAGRAIGLRLRRGQVEVELGPMRACDRPLVLIAEMIRAVTGANGELHRRFGHHAVVDVLEPVVEETQLITPPIFAVEWMGMRAAVGAQLLLLRGGAHVAFGCAAQVQSPALPVA